MLKTILFPFLFFVSFLLNAQAVSNNYTELWQKVDSLEGKGLPKSALKIVNDIFNKAKNDKNSPETVKALLFQSKYILTIEEDARLKVQKNFQRTISESNSPTKNILESILANMYWQYFQDNRYRFYKRTKTAERIDSVDFRTWDLQNLMAEVHFHFQQSLENSDLTKQLSLKDFDAILEEFEGSKKLRPTLFDFLANIALDFYKNPENQIAQPANKFEMNQEELLAPAEDFVKIEMKAKDSLSLQLQALKIYQELIRFHLKNNSEAALADVNIARLKYVHSFATFSNSEEILLATLQSEMKNTENPIARSPYMYEVASIFFEKGKTYNPETSDENRWKIKEALELCEACIATFPESKDAEKCTILRNQILEKKVSLFTEKFLPVQKNARILVNYTNIDSLYFKIYALTPNELDSFSNIYREKTKLEFIQQLSPVKEWFSVMRNEGDFQNHSTEILVPKLQNGNYLIYAATQNDSTKINAFTNVQVTDLAVIEKTGYGEAMFQIVNRNNGKPVVGAKIKMEYKRNYRGKTITTNLISDFFGNISLSESENNYRNIILHVSHQGETARFGEYYAYTYQPNEDKFISEHAFLFTDRSIYRPGQTVFFKGIVISQEKGKSSVLAGIPVYVDLYDTNDDFVSELEFTTNEFGSVQGEFILPSSGLTGKFYLEIDGEEIDLEDRTYFSVEEYKRPTFEASFQPIKETFRVNDSIDISGEAVAYAGSKITNSKVVYHVIRKAQFPYWRNWWFPRPVIKEQEIAHGETSTDENGKFEISFKAIPDTSISKESLPVFQYEITADITDLNGETRSTTSIVNVGYHTLNIGLNIEPKLNKTLKTHQLQISSKNLNGESVPAEGSIQIYKLKAPSSVIRRRPWSAPDYQDLSKERFKTLFPHEAFNNEDDPKKWEKSELVFETNFNTKKSKEIALGKIKNWKSGIYKIELKSADAFGQEILVERFTTLFDPNESAIADNKLFSIKTGKNDYRPEEIATLTLASAAENLWVTVMVEKNHQIVNTYLVKLENDKKDISIPVSEEDRGGFAVHYSYAAFNSFHSGNVRISVPYPSSKLQIETLRFRDKMKPGEEETWSFHIKGPDGEKVSAELLASMYDASLDQFQPHQWNFEPINLETYHPYLRISADNSFNLSYFNSYNPKNVKTKFSWQRYDQLNWFGFNFGNFQRAQREYLRKKYPSLNPEVKSSFKSYIPTGEIQGLVLDRLSGMPLAGVNIVIEGTIIGTQTDFDGKFSLNAKKGDKLVFSYIGFNDFVVSIGKNNYYQVKLSAAAGELDQVVVTAFGVVKEESAFLLRGKASGITINQENPNALIIINGKIATSEELENLNPEEILSTKVLENKEATALYGEAGKNGAIIITTKSVINMETVQVRKNLQETAFFFPQLKTDEEGNVSFHFKNSEALTRWKLQLLAHTKDLKSALLVKEAVTQKELMVLPNFPRFLRIGDSIQINAKIANLTEKTLSGNAVLKLYDAIDNKEISSELIISEANFKDFSVNPKGNSVVTWKLQIPDDVQAVTYKIIAKSGNFSDGVQSFLPVLSNRMLVTETMPMWVRSHETKTFTLEKLKTSSSSTLKNHRLTLEITSNPAWYAVLALPYLMEYPYECSEQTFSRFYANALASHVVNSNSRIKEVFQQWKNSDALVSNLEKNQELKSLLIQETPWVRDAKSETEQKKRIALLFDLNKMQSERTATIQKLQQNQLTSGAWPWFKGGRENRFITQYIITGFGHLKKLGAEVATEGGMVRDAIHYLDKEFLEEYNNIIRNNPKADLTKNHLTHMQIHYLYMRSFFPETPKSVDLKNVSRYYYKQMKKYWLSSSLYDKGLMSLILNRINDTETAQEILNSLKETSVVSEEMGRYWKQNQPSWFWYQAPIETQALLIEAFSEINNDTKTIDELKIWLLKNKQTNRWSTTKSTTFAVYSLLLQGSDWLAENDRLTIKIGGKPLSEIITEKVDFEAGTGYFKTAWNENKITPEMATVELEKTGEGITWGGLYWQYFEDLDKISSAETPLVLHKKLFLKRNTDRGEVIKKIGPNTKIHIGDLIRVRIEVKVDRSMEFVHMKDMRASGFEPVNVLSQYKWQDGLGYYESTRDASTNFFFDYLPKGIYVFEYDLRASNAGDFSNGITTIQCMYAPEFTSHSEGIRLKINP